MGNGGRRRLNHQQLCVQVCQFCGRFDGSSLSVVKEGGNRDHHIHTLLAHEIHLLHCGVHQMFEDDCQCLLCRDSNVSVWNENLDVVVSFLHDLKQVIVSKLLNLCIAPLAADNPLDVIDDILCIARELLARFIAKQ
mmetsp:Transcript_19265/g.30553  ORF Transcript_19265/g.30553 Transcript_19265/m.30553 type:complete len:137 (+) Transcript_19265:1679-2089(+)